jgi:AcrR family transcriptional regulator
MKADVKKERRLTRDDWIAAAAGLLAEKGIDAVRITSLSESLAVTRGSFYWHFKDRDDLLKALIRTWEETNTRALVQAVEASGTVVESVLALFETWMKAEPFAPRLDAAMRDWARRSAPIKKVVERADARRLKSIAASFERSGFEPREAFIRARILYFTQVGYYTLGVREDLADRVGFADLYVKAFTGLDLDPAVRADFRNRVLSVESKSARPKKPSQSHSVRPRSEKTRAPDGKGEALQ